MLFLITSAQNVEIRFANMTEKLFLNPSKSLEGKNNFKIDVRVNETLVIEQVRLSCDSKEKREEIILNHFLLYLDSKQESSFEIVERDNPWDFFVIQDKEYGFFVEITSFSESEDRFKKKKIEEKYKKYQRLEKIRLGDLRRLNKELTLGPEVQSCLERNKDQKNDFLVKNPVLKDKLLILSLTNMDNENSSLLAIVQFAIQSKIDKPEESHPNKNSVFLVLDNRTIKYDKEEYDLTIEELKKKQLPFLGVVIYTGFYSDDDGKNSEFYITKIK